MADKDAQIAEGRQARELLENPLLIKSYSVIENDIYQKWIRTEITDTETREALYHSLRGMLTAKSVLVNTMENGKIIEEENKGGK
tara:strand:+ start:204 stop:458 length:255 start_codon:yes stop_codon:yes gene_type:complete